jgi:hypothetical protein
MYNNIKNITLSLLIIMSIFSCTEEDKFNNPIHFGLENGAFARFSTESPSETILLSDFKENGFISDQIIDANNNISEYSLTMTANVNGTLTTIEDFKTFSSFPANVEITAQDIADALDISLLNINYGDSFKFVAKTIREDGVVFTGESPSYDAGETTIIGDEVISGGNTESTLNNPSTGYHSAMNFNFIIACDAFDPIVVAGTYDVVEGSFFSFLGETNMVREVVAGPDVNQITIIGGEWPSIGADDLILTITPNGVMVEDGYNADGVAIPEGVAGLIENKYLIEKAIVLPCIGKIDINLNLNPYSANEHKFVLQLQ